MSVRDLGAPKSLAAFDARYVNETDAAPLAQAGQTPSQAPVAPTAAGTLGSLAFAPHADHAHPSAGLYWAWGNGFDGDLNFDGSSNVTLVDPLGAAGNVTITPSGSVYTINSPLAAHDITLGGGVTLAMGQGCAIYATGTLKCPTGSATIHADGTAGAANGTAGAARPALGIAATGAGGAGNVGAGTAGSAASNPSDQWNAATGGTGGTGSGGAGAASSGGILINRNGHRWFARDPLTLLRGIMQGTDASSAGLIGSITGSAGGGGGGGDTTNKGGGGGSGGGVLIVNARAITGSIAFRSAGGAGGTPATGNCGGGAGGGGGYVLVNSTDLTGWTGAATAPGGAGGSGVGTDTAGGAGNTGIVKTTTWA